MKYNTIDIDAAKKRLRYDEKTGIFHWKVRSLAGSERTSRVKSWNSRYGGKRAGSRDVRGYEYIRINGTKIWSHRMAWMFGNGRWPIKHIDHINGDPSDNRLANLREASNAENSRNSKLSVLNTSGACGVSWNKRTSRWIAQATVDREHINIGAFTKKDDAIAARIQFNSDRGAFSERHGAA